jgi:Tol biopolymer transport system component
VQTGERPQLDALPEKLAHVVERAIETDPEDRWQSARDVKSELEWAARPVVAPASGNRGLPWLWPAVAALALLALASVYFRQGQPESRVVRSTILPPEKTSFSFINNLGPMALSPDGRRMVFAATAEDGKSQLWIRALDAPAAQPLPGTEGGQFPFWSPDSRWVGFFADMQLKKVDTAGGPPIVLADTRSAVGGSWSANGTIVFAPAAPIGSSLWKISAAGGMAAPATVVDAAARTANYLPWFLPDGEHFLFAAVNQKGGGRVNLMVGSLGSTAVTYIGKADSNAVYAEGRLLYLRERTLLAQPFDVKALRTTGDPMPVAERVDASRMAGGFVSVSVTGLLAYQTGASKGPGDDRQLTWLDRTGKTVQTVGEPRQILEIHLSPDGKSVAATQRDATGNVDVWIYDLARGLPRRFTSDPAVDLAPHWSPDGQTIAFSSTRLGHYDLYTKPADGSRAEKLLYADDQVKTPTNWSPDGKFLVYLLQKPPKGLDVFLLPLIPERAGAPLKPVPFLDTDFDEVGGQFSPDGQWFAYRTNETQQSEIYVAPFSRPAKRQQVSRNGGTTLRWRGNEIFYLAAGDQLMVAEVRTGGDRVEVGAVRKLFSGIPIGNQNWDISPDGQRILAAVPVRNQQGPEPITLVQNWAAALKK